MKQRPNIREAGLEKSGLYFNLALAVWLITLLIICLMVFLAPWAHSVTPVYHNAVDDWFAGTPLYLKPFHYFPQFVLFFMPFHFIKVPYGDILYRIFSVFFLAWGLWRGIKLMRRPIGRNLSFLCVTLISLGPSLGAILNGQANVAFAAIAVNAAVCLARAQWWGASVLLIGGVIVKPLGLVMVFLSVMGYPKVIWRSALCIVTVVVLPFLFAEHSYILSQYKHSIAHLFTLSGQLRGYRFADINGLLRTLGIGLTGAVSQITRVVAGVVTAVVWMIGSKRIRGPAGAWLFLGLSTTYLILFNPMTEGNSYVIVAPSIALYALSLLSIKRFSNLGWGLVFMSFSIYPLPEILRGLYKNFGVWSRPLLMLIFYAFLVAIVFTRKFESLNCWQEKA